MKRSVLHVFLQVALKYREKRPRGVSKTRLFLCPDTNCAASVSGPGSGKLQIESIPGHREVGSRQNEMPKTNRVTGRVGKFFAHSNRNHVFKG